MKKIFSIFIFGLLAIVFGLLIYGLQFITADPAHLGAVENIDGIPFSQIGQTYVVTEKLAHADVYLDQPGAFRTLQLNVTFDPKDLQSLDVGVRENAFWLSYPKVRLYEREEENTPSGEYTKTIRIPLTDKIQDRDQSVDLMFFAQAQQSQATEDEKDQDTAYWLLHSIQPNIGWAMPTMPELKDYIRAIVHKEKPL